MTEPAPPPPPQQPPKAPARELPDRRLLLAGVAAGLFYGLFFRLVFGADRFENLFGVMSIAFIFLVPFAMGYLTVAVGERRGPWSWLSKLFVPILTALVTLFSALALAWEGLICIYLWLPLYAVLALLGGLVAGVVGVLVRRQRARTTLAGVVALLPLLVAPGEHRFAAPDEHRTVRTSIDIAADPATVWRAIERVRRFTPAEHRFNWSHALGFPRPVEATLDREGVGGVRHASFEGGVVFVETITVWDPERRLTFSIFADPESIPMRTLDQHVTVGGEFFDVLEGDYRLEPLTRGGVRLHLASTHRLSTRFNLYSRLWTDFVMRDVQQNILQLLKARCERGEP